MLIHSPNGAFSALFSFYFTSFAGWFLFCRINTFKLPNLASRIWWSNWRYLRTRRRSTVLSIASFLFPNSVRCFFFFTVYFLHFCLTFISNSAEKFHQVRQDNVKTINFHRLRLCHFYLPTKLQQLGFY